jgi:hypothetical protein
MSYNPAQEVQNTINTSVRMGVQELEEQEQARMRANLGGAGSNFFKDAFQGATQKSAKHFKPIDAVDYLARGVNVGEQAVGSTLGQTGQRSAEITARLQQILDGDSAAFNQMKQSQAQSQKELAANQMKAGGGGQMAAGQRAALKRQQVRDAAMFKEAEYRKALSNYDRKVGADLRNTFGIGGQVAGVATSGIKPDSPKQSEGLLTSLLGGLV